MNFGLPPAEEEFCICERRLIDRQEALMQVYVARLKLAKPPSRGAARRVAFVKQTIAWLIGAL